MIVSVDDGLNDLYDGLKESGYQTYKISQGIASDIVIYSRGLNSAFVNMSVPISSGTLMVNGDNMDMPQITSIIETRAYSSIF